MSTLTERLEKEIPSLPGAKRAAATLDAVEVALPIPPEDFKTLSIAAWGLDYFVGRSHSSTEREDARDLRDRVLKPLRELIAPPGPEDGEWAVIPGGYFIGSPKGIGYLPERPAHKVTISPFRMAVRPVTNRNFRRLVPGLRGDDEFPMGKVSWYEAYTYASWLGGRLPTDAEWEYAARAGSPTNMGRVAPAKYDSYLHPVGQMEPNPWGLYDMYEGWEWVADLHAPFGKEPEVDPWGPPGGGYRTMISNHWCDVQRAGVVVVRIGRRPGEVADNLSFRVVLLAGSELSTEFSGVTLE